MKIEYQVCSLELAKKLKYLLVKQKSLFYYRAFENPLNGLISEDTVTDNFWNIFYYDDKYSKSCDWEISAFTATELLEKLPKFISSETDTHLLTMQTSKSYKII